MGNTFEGSLVEYKKGKSLEIHGREVIGNTLEKSNVKYMGGNSWAIYGREVM